MWEFNDLIYRANSFVAAETAPFLNFFNIQTQIIRDNFTIFYLLYISLIILFLFGIGKRFTALFLFLFIEVIQNLAWLTLNGGDNILKFAVLYFVFIDSYSRFSIKPLSYKTSLGNQINNFLSNLGGFSMCLHFCLIYFISAIHKINADVWFHGVATYYILGSERFQGTPWNMILVKNGFFVLLSTYGTILIELLFPFLVWVKKLKPLLIIAAIGLHLSIGIFMMLYDFQILFIMILGFFVSNQEWYSISKKVIHIQNIVKSKILLLKSKAA